MRAGDFLHCISEAERGIVKATERRLKNLTSGKEQIKLSLFRGLFCVAVTAAPLLQ